MAQIGELVIKLKIVGVGGKRRLRFFIFIARILGVKLDVKEDAQQPLQPDSVE